MTTPTPQNSLTFRAFANINVKRSNDWHSGKRWTPADWMTAAGGEFGEAGNILKKLKRTEDGFVGNNMTDPELRAMLGEELADTIGYLFLLADELDINLPLAAAVRFNQVSANVGFNQIMYAPVTFRGFHELNQRRSAECYNDDGWTPNDWWTATDAARGKVSDVITDQKRGIQVRHAEYLLSRGLADTLTFLFLLAAAVNVDLEHESITKFNAVSAKLGVPYRIALGFGSG